MPKAKKAKKPKKPKLTELCMLPEPLNAAGKERELCQKCAPKTIDPDGPYVPGPYVPGGTNVKWSKKLLAILPTSFAALSEPSWQILVLLLKQAGYRPIDVAWLSTTRCDGASTLTQGRCCRPFLLHSLQKLKPKLIVVFGADALKAVLSDGKATNITDYRGKKLSIPGTKLTCYATYHPDATAYNSAIGFRIEEDLKRPSLPSLKWPGLCGVTSPSKVGFDVEFTHDQPPKVLDWGFADRKGAFSVLGDDIGALRKRYNPPNTVKTLCAHSAPQDVDFLVREGLAKESWVRGDGVRDSYILMKMYDENRTYKGGYELENTLRSFYNVESWKEKTRAYSRRDATDWPADLRAERCRLDAWASMVLVEKLEPLTKGPVGFTHRLNACLHRIELAGAHVHYPTLSELKREYLQRQHRAQNLVRREAARLGLKDYEPTNDRHIRDALFGKLKLKPISYTRETGEPQADQVTLKEYAQEHKLARFQLEFNDADTVLRTFILGVLKKLQPTASTSYRFLPVRINPGGARTLRRSSSAPNMQNWPPQMRATIRSRYGRSGRVLGNDFGKLEVLLMGYEAGEDRLIDYFLNKGGYISLGEDFFGKTIVKDTKDYRLLKAAVLGTNYQQKARGLAFELWYKQGIRLAARYDDHVAECQRILDRYFGMFPRLRVFAQQCEHELVTTQQIITRTGRVRHLPLPFGPDTENYWHMRNQAINVKIQGLAADVTASAMIDVEEALLRQYRLSYCDYQLMLLERCWADLNMPLLMNEVHDELVYDMPDNGKRKRDEELIVETMKAVPSLRKIAREVGRDFDLDFIVETKSAVEWRK